MSYCGLQATATPSPAMAVNTSVHVGPTGQQILNWPQLTFLVHKVRPFLNSTLRRRQKPDIWKCLGDCARHRISISHAGNRKFGIRVDLPADETKCDLDVFNDLQEIWPAR